MTSQMVNGAMELLHDQSLPTIELLQTSFPDNKQLMMNISHFFDPRYVFLIYAPLLFALNKRVGHRLVTALTITEWANQILKWLLAGERPYWYVHERGQELAMGQNETSLSGGVGLEAGEWPHIRQFPVTCELGAGSPSGHAMVTATVWYVLVDAQQRGELNLTGGPASKELASFGKQLARLGWSLYTLSLVLVSLSRVYLACHFPHQCVCGAILGVAVARLVVERLPEDNLRRRHYVLATLAMFTSAMTTYGLLRALGMDPLWSVGKGMRWCVKKEYIHLDTTPFFSMTRYLGFSLGAGLALGEPESKLNCHSRPRRLASLVVGSAFSLALGQFLLALPLPRANLNLFYLISFMVYTLMSYAFAGPIPRAADRLLAACWPDTRTSGKRTKAN